MQYALRLVVSILLALGLAAAWLLTAFLVSSPGDWPAELAFGPGDYLRSHVLPYEAAAWVYGKESQWAHHSFLIKLSLLIWTTIFTPLTWVAVSRSGVGAAVSKWFRGPSSNNSLERPSKAKARAWPASDMMPTRHGIHGRFAAAQFNR